MSRRGEFSRKGYARCRQQSIIILATQCCWIVFIAKRFFLWLNYSILIFVSSSQNPQLINVKRHFLTVTFIPLCQFLAACAPPKLLIAARQFRNKKKTAESLENVTIITFKQTCTNSNSPFELCYKNSCHASTIFFRFGIALWLIFKFFMPELECFFFAFISLLAILGKKYSRATEATTMRTISGNQRAADFVQLHLLKFQYFFSDSLLFWCFEPRDCD